jgi:hypothetical protein
MVARLFLVHHTKKWEKYQKNIKYTKWPHLPNDHKIGTYVYQHLPLQEHPKFTPKLGFFWFENMPSGIPGLII